MIYIKNGEIENLSIGGIVLGYLSNETYREEEIHFGEGDLAVFYTDGITEAMNENSEEFGEKRLLNAIKNNKSKNSYEIRKNILNELKKYNTDRIDYVEINRELIKIYSQNQDQ